jgi:hypothetical protein
MNALPTRKLPAGQSLLRFSLLGNAIFSAFCGLVLLRMTETMGVWLGLQVQSVYRWLGIGLCLFAAALLYQVSKKRLSTLHALITTAADFTWVVATVVLLAGFPDLFSTQGKIILTAVAVAVTTFGSLQVTGIHRIFKIPSTDRYRHCLLFAVPQPAEEIWKAVGDLGAISEYAPFLKDSKLTAGDQPGVGAVRTCTNQENQSWSEECTDYQDGRSLSLRFLSEEPNFPFPVEMMIGGWNIIPEGKTCELEVWWELRPKGKFPGVILLPIFASQTAKGLGETIDAMIRQNSEGKPSDPPSLLVRRIPRLC